IAQVVKSFRNEINPRNFTFRSREFEQMEIEFFCHPDDAARWYKYWRDTRFQWYVDHGLRSDRLRLRDHDRDELAFYSTATAVGGGRPRDAGLPLRGVHRGRGRRRAADGPQVPPEAGADQGGGLPAGEEGRHAREGRGDLPRAQTAFLRLL